MVRTSLPVFDLLTSLLYVRSRSNTHVARNLSGDRRPRATQVDPRPVMSNWLTPYQYAKEKGLRPQIVYYLIRQRAAPHKIVDGKLLVDMEVFNTWLQEYLFARFTRHAQTKHVHGPECYEGVIALDPGDKPPTTLPEFLHVIERQRKKAGARRGGKRSIAEFENMIDMVSQIPD